MPTYVERRRQIEAWKVTPDDVTAIAEWCNGWVMGSSVVYRLGEVLMEARDGDYVVRDPAGTFTHVAGERFEVEWEPAGDE